MTIVGWDDTIPASIFRPKTASQNGGWIIKNSYNSLPYFYLSYDSAIGNTCGFKYANRSEFDFNYFYDNVFVNFSERELKTCVNINFLFGRAPPVAKLPTGRALRGSAHSCYIRRNLRLL